MLASYRKNAAEMFVKSYRVEAVRHVGAIQWRILYIIKTIKLVFIAMTSWRQVPAWLPMLCNPQDW